jgi:hypothetical protein
LLKESKSKNQSKKKQYAMNVTNMLLEPPMAHPDQPSPSDMQQEQTHNHHYPTRRAMSSNSGSESRTLGDPILAKSDINDCHSTTSSMPKTVSFELLVDEARNAKARLPMRVQIHPHDTTEDIIASVKSFFGLYDPQGVSFEDNSGNTLIARYENFQNNSTVPVRVVSEYSSATSFSGAWGYRSASPSRLRDLDEQLPLPPQPAQILNYGQPPSRPMSRVSRKESASPKPAQLRNGVNSKNRSRSGAKNQTTSFQAGLDELNDAHNGYSSSDGIAASVSSRKARSEQLATAEISVDNIVEGGRRKRAKFESSVCIHALLRIHYSNNLGTTAFCSSASTCAKFYIICLSTKTFNWSRCYISFR